MFGTVPIEIVSSVVAVAVAAAADVVILLCTVADAFACTPLTVLSYFFQFVV